MIAAIQGERGSFSHQAVRAMLPKAKVLPCALSVDVFERLKKGTADAAVIPIENSLAGPVTEHYDLLLKHNVYIEREFNLRIVHNLIAISGVKLSGIKRVYSHPVALAQCLKFFRKYRRIKAEPFYDTAGSVKHLLENGIRDAAAIASQLAAKEYGGAILKSGIQDNNQNYTRFLLVKKLNTGRLPVSSGANKTSIAFSVKNAPGTLYSALSAFAQEGISLSKIESRPVPGRPWQYVFYADLICGATPTALRALSNLRRSAESLKILGIYPAAKK